MNGSGGRATVSSQRRRTAILGAAVEALGWALGATSCFGWGTALADGESARTMEVRCEAQNVSVRSPGAADASLACKGARDAIDFLAAQGVHAKGSISIDLVRELPVGAERATAGCYLESGRRVVILTFFEFEKFKAWFNLPVNAQLYRSLVAHEVAHALTAQSFKIATPSIAAKEYVAYVTMLATMAPGLRERVLSQYPGQGFEGERQMSTTIYLLDPMRFGVRAYRHFLRPENGRDFLHAVLSGKAMTD